MAADRGFYPPEPEIQFPFPSFFPGAIVRLRHFFQLFFVLFLSTLAGFIGRPDSQAHTIELLCFLWRGWKGLENGEQLARYIAHSHCSRSRIALALTARVGAMMTRS